MKAVFRSFCSAVILVLAFSDSLTARNVDDVVIGKYVKIFSKVMNEERKVLISVPDDYNKTSESYPLLVVLDGSVKKMLEAEADLQMAQYCYTPDMIVVAIENTDRNRDMTPGDDSSPKFLKFINEELIPYMKKEYRVDDNQKIIYGGSNAGLFVVFSFLDNPDNFSAYIASSPTICHRKKFMMNKLKELRARDIKINKYLYIIYGDVDYPQVTDTLAVFIPWLEGLRAKGLRMRVDYLPDEGHIPFGSLRFGLMALYEDYGIPNDKMGSGGLDTLKTYYDRYSKKVGYVQKPPKQKLLLYGQMLLSKNKIKEAVDVFEYSSGLYADDYECNLLLAVAHYKNKSYDYARKSFLKTKDLMEKIKETNDPPIEEWKEMKRKFG